MKRTKYLIFSLTLALGACSDDDTPTPDASPDVAVDAAVDTAPDIYIGDAFDTEMPVNKRYLSGPRLKARWIETEETGKAFYSWWDDTLIMDCGFGTALDGKLRCLPLMSGSWSRGFSDSNCTTPLAVDRTEPRGACPAGKYFVSLDESQCPARARVELLGDEVTPSSYYVLEGGACKSSSADGAKIYAITGEAQPTEFVAGTIDIGEAKDGLAPTFIIGEDGSKGFHELTVTAHGDARCAFAQAMDGESRCLPRLSDTALVIETHFTDDGCSSYLAQAMNSECVGSFGTRYDDRGSCSPKFSIHPLTGPATGAFYTGEPGSCTATGQSGGPGYYTTGAEIPSSEFPSAAAPALPEGSTERIQQYEQVTAGGLVLAGGWYDTQRGESCSYKLAADGKLRCMPAGQHPGPYYSDAGCTTRLYQIFGCAQPKYVYEIDRSLCPARTSVFEAGPEHTGDVYAKYQDGPCTLDSSPPKVRSRGAAVPDADLAKGNMCR